jgi:thiamine-phosphate diphosphorylase
MVTDRCRYGERDREASLDRLIEDVRAAVRGGVDLIQIRERGLPDRALLGLVRRAIACAGSQTRILVNGRADVALAASARGVHLPADAPAASRVRQMMPRGAIIGKSVHSVEEAIAAESDGGSDYLTFGTIYQSASKPPGHVAAGLDALECVCRAVKIPVVAIGGITPERAAAVVATGASGIAAIGMFITAREDGGDATETIVTRVADVRASFDAVSPPHYSRR